MHLSSVGLAFAKSIKQEHLDDYLEVYTFTFMLLPVDGLCNNNELQANDAYIYALTYNR